MRTLNPRQERFVSEFVLSGNGSDAARRAGYSEKTARVIASELLTKPAIFEAVCARQAAYAAELQITKDDVISGILSAVGMAREQANPAVMIQGCTALAKLCGFYTPVVVNHGVSGDLQVHKSKFAGMTDAELLVIAQGVGSPS